MAIQWMENERTVKMSKIQRKRKHTKKTEEESLKRPSSHEDEDISSIIDSLSSSQEIQRINSCNMLCNIFTFHSKNYRGLEQLSSPELLSKLSLVLEDPSSLVKIEATSAILSLIASNQTNIVNKLLDSPIFSVILSSLQKYLLETSTSTESTLIIKQIDCLTAMVVASERTFQKLEDSIFQIILITLQSAIIAPEIQISLAHFLFVSSDNNPHLLDILQKYGGIEILTSILMNFIAKDVQTSPVVSSFHLLPLYCFGCLINLGQALDFRTCISWILSLIEYNPTLTPSISFESASVVDTSALEASQLCLELITNLLAKADNENEAQDQEEGWEDVEETIETRISPPPPSHSLSHPSELEVELTVPPPPLGPLLRELSLGPVLSRSLSRITSHLSSLILPTSTSLSLSSASSSSTQSSSSHPHQSIGLEALRLTEALDRHASALINLLLNSPSPPYPPSELDSFMQVLLPLIELLLRTIEGLTPSTDHEGKPTPLWPIDDSLDLPSLIHTFLDACSTSLQALRQLVESNTEGLAWPDTPRLVALLGEALSLPHLELCLPALEGCAALGASNALPAPSSLELTRVILTRISRPSTISREKTSLPSSSSLSLPSLQVIQACLLALIDLHSGDDPELLRGFNELQCTALMAQAAKLLKQGCMNPNGKGKGGKGGGGGGGGVGRQVQSQFQDTLTNTREFIKYKNDFSETLK